MIWRRLATALGVLLGLYLLFALATFTVDVTEQAVLLRMGKARQVITEPGLHWRVPFLDRVRYFDRRVLQVDAAPNDVITADKKTILVDSYTRWRIVDPLRFYQRVQTTARAARRLDAIVYSSLREEIGRHTLQETVAEARTEIMERVAARANTAAAVFGVEVIDVRIKRADLPPENEKAVFERMRSERIKEANRYRAEGRERATMIRAEAEKERTILLAEAYREAQELLGQGEAEATAIYAKAYGKDPAFFRFLRGLEAYDEALTTGTTVLLGEDHPFLRVWKEGR